MSRVDEVLARIESEVDFALAVRAEPRAALASSGLTDSELEMFEESGRPLWRTVFEHTSHELVETPDGGLPPPPPPFTVHHSRVDDRADPAEFRADPGLALAVEAVRSARGPAREAAAVDLMGRIG